MDLNRWKPVLLAIPLLLAGGAAQAQSVVDVTVPFDFTVQHHVMPAGRYRIEHDAQYPSTLVIRRAGRRPHHAGRLDVVAPGHDPAGEMAAGVISDNAYQLADVMAIVPRSCRPTDPVVLVRRIEDGVEPGSTLSCHTQRSGVGRRSAAGRTGLPPTAEPRRILSGGALAVCLVRLPADRRRSRAIRRPGARAP